MDTRAHSAAVFGLSERAGADRDDLLYAEIVAVITIALEHFEAAPLGVRRDQPGAIDAFTQAGNLGKIVQHSEPAGVSCIRDQTKNRIGADIEKGTAARAHRAAAVRAAS